MIDLSKSTYTINNICAFNKVKDPYGGLSNMAGGYPIEFDGIIFRTSEALFQITRFPDFPNYQQEIIDQKGPMGAKMKSKKYKPDTRSDWYDHRIEIMDWCLHLKLACNFQTFGDLLESTGAKDIVEARDRDPFWGAKTNPINSNMREGYNYLGKLLVELREEYRQKKGTDELLTVAPPKISNFLLLGNPIGTITIP
jgi:ribA/ribD-fused uncharacterized protein